VAVFELTIALLLAAALLARLARWLRASYLAACPGRHGRRLRPRRARITGSAASYRAYRKPASPGLYQRRQTLTDAQSRWARDRISSGDAARSFQAVEQASRMASWLSQTLWLSRLLRR
jgi:hypothetical protein